MAPLLTTLMQKKWQIQNKTKTNKQTKIKTKQIKNKQKTNKTNKNIY